MRVRSRWKWANTHRWTHRGNGRGENTRSDKNIQVKRRIKGRREITDTNVKQIPWEMCFSVD